MGSFSRKAQEVLTVWPGVRRRGGLPGCPGIIVQVFKAFNIFKGAAGIVYSWMRARGREETDTVVHEKNYIPYEIEGMLGHPLEMSETLP